MATVIVGGGIIGLSTAYCLSLLQPELASNHQIHIVDSASELLLSASGHSGGFLAKDWFSPAVSSLGALSFHLHKELAQAHDGPRNWGYAPSTAYSLAIEERGVGSKKNKGKDWLLEGTSRAGVASAVTGGQEQMPSSEGAKRNEMLNDDGTPAWITKQENGSLEVIGSGDSCAQVEPRQLCLWLRKQCEDRGVKLHTKCMPTGIVKGEHGEVVGVKVSKDCEVYEKNCKNIVITAGAWTPNVFQKIFHSSNLRIPISSLAGYSIVVRSPRYTRPILDPTRHGENSAVGVSQGVFCAPSSSWAFAPEAFSRVPPDGTPELWVGGLNDSHMKLPKLVDEVENLQDSEKMEELRNAAVLLTGLSQEGDNLKIDDLKVVRQGLCFRPVSDNGRPIISKVPETALGHDIKMSPGAGVFVASGHGPWGISLSLGTGQVMAEMLLGRKLSADISSLALK
ncbi:hypothetical protein H2198_009117 [Neophaeococcomyces mojaviensis]|uniref:Uncharacterized protein n=1 Tax=Neophaeococcomyces mojaviensis TaxID=3383035 RepID=A0ACC2ZVN4_9EURO|nr:hypothetical protein H2198_009117 [Knufia sp. JES_112]